MRVWLEVTLNDLRQRFQRDCKNILFGQDLFILIIQHRLNIWKDAPVDKKLSNVPRRISHMGIACRI